MDIWQHNIFWSQDCEHELGKENTYSSFFTAGVYVRTQYSKCLLNIFCYMYLKFYSPASLCVEKKKFLWSTHRAGKLWEVPNCSPSTYLDMVWIAVFKLINMSVWPPPLWHSMWISSAMPASTVVSVPHTLFTSSNSYYLSEYGGFEVATNPTALYLLSVDRRTGLLNILRISNQAIEIHQIIVA